MTSKAFFGMLFYLTAENQQGLKRVLDAICRDQSKRQYSPEYRLFGFDFAPVPASIYQQPCLYHFLNGLPAA